VTVLLERAPATTDADATSMSHVCRVHPYWDQREECARNDGCQAYCGHRWDGAAVFTLGDVECVVCAELAGASE
jgi:hypothetical protein